MQAEKNKVLKAGLIYTVCNFIVKGLSFLTMPIFTRIMSSSDIGLFSNITSWFNILSIITTFEIYSSVSLARFDYKEDLDSYVSSSLFLSSIITSIFYILVLIFHSFFENLFMIDFFTLNLMFIYLLVYSSIQMFQIKNQIKYNYIPIVVVSLSNAILSTVISIIFVLTFNNKLEGRIVGYFIPLIIIATIVYIILMVKGKSISKKYWKYALKISFPLIWHLLAGYILSSSDRIMITRLISSDANALYSVAYTISMMVSILWSSMNNAWSPWAYDKMNKEDYESLKNKSKPYTILFLIVVYLFMLITPELLLLMGGKYYLQAKYVMPPVMIGYVFQFVYSLYVNIEFYHKKQKNIAIGTVIAAIANLILNFIFIPKLGYIAAAYTTLVGYILLYIIHFTLVKKLNCTWWYDTNFFIKVLLLSVIAIPIFCVLYKFTLLRYSIIMILFITLMIFIIKNKNILIIILKEKDFSLITKLNKRKKEVK